MAKVHGRMGLKALKIAVGSCAAITLAELFGLEYATSAGIVTLLTVQNTKMDTIRLALDRFFSFLLSICLIAVCFHLPGIGWVNYGIYLLLMVTACYVMDWQNTISVNAVIGTHFMLSADYSAAFVTEEFLLIAVGTGFALLMNWKMPDHGRRIREDIHQVENDMQRVLLALAGYLRGEHGGEEVWDRLDRMETYLHEGMERAHEHAHNTLREEDRYYADYLEMRLQQCGQLQLMKARMRRVARMPSQAEIISCSLENLVHYMHEQDIPEQQMEELQRLFKRMQQEALPVSREEFENRAILYHVMMDLEEFLLIKKHFLEINGQRPKQLQ